MSTFRRFLFGFRSFFVGFKMVRRHPSMVKYLIIPMFFAFVFLATGTYFAIEYVPTLIASFIPAPTGFWSQSLYWLTTIFAGISAFLLIALNSFVLANIINIPVNVKLCETMLKKEFQWTAPDKSFAEYIKAFFYFLLIGLAKTAIIVCVGILAFLMSFIPFLGIFAAAIAMLVLAFDCSDITYEIKEWNLQQRFNFFRSHKIEYLGFAMGIGMFSLIPGLNFVLLPFIVLGASHMVHTLDTRTSHAAMSVS